MYDDDRVSSFDFTNKNSKVKRSFMKTATILFYAQTETTDKMIKRLPPHSGQGCITNTRDKETIDELINRIPTSEGLYKMHWILSQKGKS